MKKVKNKRTLGTIGKEQFDFEISKEEDIYLNCCGLLKKSKEKKMECKHSTYSEWENGIQKKYEGTNRDFLEEFSRYLQNLINVNYPILEYNHLVVSGLISVSFSILGAEFIRNWDFQPNASFWENYIFSMVMFCILIGAIVFVMLITFSPVKDQSMRIVFLKDYKKVIDKLVECKRIDETVS